jgi:hypothetical protein
MAVVVYFKDGESMTVATADSAGQRGRRFVATMRSNGKDFDVETFEGAGVLRAEVYQYGKLTAVFAGQGQLPPEPKPPSSSHHR